MIHDPLLTWKGRRVRLPGDSPATVALKVPSAPQRPGSLFFVPSPLEGWGIDLLLERLPPDSAVVVFEKDSELRRLMEVRFSEYLAQYRLDPRLHILEEDSESCVAALFRQLPLSRLRRCQMLTLNGAWIPERERYQQVFARFEQGLNRWWSNRVTGIHMGPLWIRNLFDNLAHPDFETSPWPDWGNQPVLVCGAGTTLESALPWAVANRDQWRILAADTALPVLKAAGIKPDAVVCLEAQHANLRDFCGWDSSGIQLFADLTSFPPSSRVLGSTPCWFITEFAGLSFLRSSVWDEAGIRRLPPLGSVGVAAAWVAWKLTTGPVVLTGLDFSFPPGKTHARSAPALAAFLAKTSRVNPPSGQGVWGRPGTQLTPSGWLTTPVLKGYGDVLAEQAQAQAHRSWVWSESGYPLGLPVFAGQPVQGSRLEEKTAPRTSDPRAISQWLLEQEQRWLKTLELFEALNADPGSLRVKEALTAELLELDYLTFSFPDPEFRWQSDWLIRAQVQVRWLLQRLASKRSPSSRPLPS